MSDEPITKTLDPLDMIALEAGQGEAQTQADIDGILNPNPEPVIDPAQTWAQIPFAIGGLLGMVMPELRQHYTESACLAWGQGMAQVSDKYGWDAGETISKWTPECMLLMASLPLVLPTVAALKARRVEAERQQPQPARELRQQGPQPGDGTIDLSNPMDAQPGGFSEPA